MTCFDTLISKKTNKLFTDGSQTEYEILFKKKKGGEGKSILSFYVKKVPSIIKILSSLPNGTVIVSLFHTNKSAFTSAQQFRKCLVKRKVELSLFCTS